ncbi:MAG: hypothetical protein A2931_00370 [Candidatus Niyogibacteria bacterium RIFCSPLOWO2_01_FULL_45_48]|uniref:Ribulose-phosphate 3-epimerase n=2 Tax=Candidatus Niyogiibacteriota TaxID=1817912 RepID=A0A1G2EZB6_9BACT|nr:MAG: hypothetical protein A2931_00370 [Candidatus Niyogibacteria bacterium RIFCSPLOWO2_01_FULL_45_48]OGZ30614.1 MAG: hypothetical protein A2835_03525 [Candidatus Niyogibacteria bacterium RIFCSPHIGHO2_01_FULL_45_28]OGZ31125.1 MAG: hypothetical protein A3J00_03350 [Candidatus Niyogibacteria bacterium RIFCSPLOWO2_02_FULL_45_13]
MKAKLVPAANEASFEEVVKKVRLIEELAKEFDLDEMQIDVSDGTFTPTTVWHEPKDLVGFETKLKLDFHLMISDMDTRVGDWLIEPVRKITFHLEAAHDPALVLEKIKESGREAGIAFNPETPVESLEPFFGKVNSFLILGVNPGASGQGMLPETAEKIRALRNACKGCIIGIDGGVTLENARELTEAGADYIVAASAIFRAEDIKKAIKDLIKIL